MQRMLRQALGLICCHSLLLIWAEPAFARSYSLWGGQATFKLPTSAKIEEHRADGQFPDECVVTPSGRTKNVAAVIVREKLSTAERTMSFAEYARRLRKQFAGAEGVKVVLFSADRKRQRVRIEVAGLLPDWVPVPIERPKNAKALGSFVSYRTEKYSFGAFAITTSKDWKSRLVAPYRRILTSLRVGR